ncbi:MAG: energy transducer TonB [Flavipsychrobacter sp.]|nr:energy transducer TonB [Flavipsychrobacter sp.]
MKKALLLNLMLLLSAVRLYAQTKVADFETELPTVEKKPVSDSIYKYVDEMPEPTFNLNEYLAGNMRYPPDALDNGIQGRLIVKFIVNVDGSLDSIHITGNKIINGESLEREAIRVVKNMPKWKPGKMNGKHVRVYYTQPITWRQEIINR